MASKREKFVVEVPVRSSPSILYEFISVPTRLQEWFADLVEDEGNQFTFTWDGSEDVAERLEMEENVFVKYRWDYQDENEFFEFRIDKSPITNEILLRVTDFADSYDIENQKQLWESQIGELKHRIGS